MIQIEEGGKSGMFDSVQLDSVQQTLTVSSERNILWTSKDTKIYQKKEALTLTCKLRGKDTSAQNKDLPKSEAMKFQGQETQKRF